MKGFGVDDLEAGTIAAGAALHYLAETQHHQVKHIAHLHRIEEEHHVWMDRFTRQKFGDYFNRLLPRGNFTLVDVTRLIPHDANGSSATLKRWLAFPSK